MLVTLVKYEKYQEVPTDIITDDITNEQPTTNHDLRKKEYNNTPLTPLKGGNTGGEKTESPGEETATLTPELIDQREGSAKGQAKGKREKKEKYFLDLNEAIGRVVINLAGKVSDDCYFTYWKMCKL